MNTENNKSVAVIGAGIIGVNCAAELQALGFNVTLLDKTGIGEGCSKGNAGHFAAEQVFPLAEVSLLWQLPKLLMDPLGPIALSPSYLPKVLPWFIKFIANMLQSKRSKNSEALKTLNKHAISYYLPILKAANAKHLLTKRGSLLVFEKASLKAAKKQYQHYRNAGIAVKLLSRQQVLLLEPNLSEKIQYALYFTEVAHTADPFAICTSIGNYALAIGAKYQQFIVKKIEHRANKVNLISDEKHLTFDLVVIATGAWSKPLLNQLGYHLPIEAERGYSLDLEQATEAELSRPVASADRRFIMTPMTQGLRLSGTVEFAGLKQKANMQRADMLYRHAKELLVNIAPFDKDTATDQQRWLGFRPSLPDSLPVIGQAPNHANVFFALGHQHLGLTQGAITGKLIGQLMTNKETVIDISPFCISRFN
ncbi:MAG: glycine/D-amino acid oxidase-like deaminating enzyme [Alteromonadaceae bacterium]|jgi:glycine/D-amino acid oxidase-like deaminating enzyme